MIFDLSPEENRQKRDMAMLDPLTTEPEAPGMLKGAAYGTGMGIIRAGARSAQTIGMAGATLQMAQDKIFGTDTVDRYFAMVDRVATKAVDHWIPPPGSVGAVGNVLGGLGEIVLPLMAGGGNPSLLIANQQMGASVDLVRAGVDSKAAINVGAVQGVAAAAGFKVAGYGSNVWERMATGAAGNVTVNKTAAEISQRTLDSWGYKEEAKKFDPLDPTARIADIIIGAAFGGIQGKSKPTSAQVDAALTLRNSESVVNSQPGRPLNMQSDVAGQQALAEALKALNEGAPVDLAKATAGASWELKPAAKAVNEALNGGTPKIIADAAAKAGVDPTLANTIANMESEGKPSAKNPKSTATGLFQVLDSTWKEFGGTPENRNDPQAQAEIGAKIIADYSSKLETSLGRPIAPHEAYLAHLLGPGGAAKVLKADADTPLIDVVRGYDRKNADAIVNNNGMAGMTAGEAIAKWQDKTAKASITWTGEQEIALNTKLLQASELSKQAAAAPDNPHLLALADEAMNAAEDMRAQKVEQSRQLESEMPKESAPIETKYAEGELTPQPKPLAPAETMPDGKTLEAQQPAPPRASASASGEEPTRQQSPSEIAAAKAIETHPDLVIHQEDGTTISAKEMYEQSQREIADAANDSEAFSAAVNCLLEG